MNSFQNLLLDFAICSSIRNDHTNDRWCSLMSLYSHDTKLENLPFLSKNIINTCLISTTTFKFSPTIPPAAWHCSLWFYPSNNITYEGIGGLRNRSLSPSRSIALSLAAWPLGGDILTSLLQQDDACIALNADDHSAQTSCLRTARVSH